MTFEQGDHVFYEDGTEGVVTSVFSDGTVTVHLEDGRWRHTDAERFDPIE